LIQDLAAGGNSPLEMTALAKYASPQALPRIRAIYESQRDSCQPELMAYFVRVDPEYADACSTATRGRCTPRRPPARRGISRPRRESPPARCWSAT